MEWQNALFEEMKELRADVRQIRKEVTHYKGFIGGVVWTAGALGAFISFVATYMFKGHH